MKGTSFRDILAQFLEETEAAAKLQDSSGHPPTPNQGAHFQTEPPPLLQWKSANFRPAPKHAYAKAERAPGRSISTTGKILPTRPQRQAREAAPERVFKREELSHLGQDAVHTLLALGAIELKHGVSSGLVKRAHRRLAKALHPDRIAQNLPVLEKARRREQFLMLQAAYETLSAEVKALDAKTSSGSACGSGSASGQGSPHQDAA